MYACEVVQNHINCAQLLGVKILDKELTFQFQGNRGPTLESILRFIPVGQSFSDRFIIIEI